jgi:hypothetical protein
MTGIEPPWYPNSVARDSLAAVVVADAMSCPQPAVMARRARSLTWASVSVFFV